MQTNNNPLKHTQHRDIFNMLLCWGYLTMSSIKLCIHKKMEWRNIPLKEMTHTNLQITLVSSAWCH